MREIESWLAEFKQSNVTVCIVSHNLDFIARVSDRIVVLDAGRIRYDGPKSGILNDGGSLRKFGLDEPEIVKLCRRVAGLNNIPVPDVYSIDEPGRRPAVRRLKNE